jgi:hypothetical protein
VNTVIEVVIAVVIAAIIDKVARNEPLKATNWSPLRVLIYYFLPFAASWTLSPAFSIW